MKADYLSYKRAASVALLGLGLQLAMGLTLLIYGFVAKPRADQVAISVGLLVLAGGLIWLLLAILFDQHRRERIEDMETQALISSGARDASVFTESADDFRVAAKRLAWMYRLLVPVVSLLYAAGLGALGVWRYRASEKLAFSPDFVSTIHFGWAIALGLGVGFTGFIFARYVAGMAKQQVWTNLRAGAGAAVAAAVLALLWAVAQFVDYVDPNILVRWMHVIVPAVMILLATEVVLNFLFGLYAPRKPGEYPRPAVDSKVLSFAAAPDRIAKSIGEALNYQFGFDVTGNWFYQLVSRSLVTLLLVGALVIWLLTCVAVIQPNEQGLRVRMGQRIGDQPLSPGPYVKLPWPLERIETYPAQSARRLNLGGDQPKLPVGRRSILWTNDHGVAEYHFAVQPVAEDLAAREATRPNTGGRDFALVSVEIPLYYRVENLTKFDKFGAPDQRDAMLLSIGRNEAFAVMATETIDSVLGDGRSRISQKLRDRIDARFESLDAGVRVLFVGIEGVHPPRETAASFENIVQGTQQRQGAVLGAEDEANKSLIEVAGSVQMASRIVAKIDELQALTQKSPGKGDEKSHSDKVASLRLEIQQLLVDAGGSAASQIQQARADRWVRHLEARGSAESFVGKNAGFVAAPEYFIAKTYFDMLADTMKPSRLFIVADDRPLRVDMDLKDAASMGNVFLKQKEE